VTAGATLNKLFIRRRSVSAPILLVSARSTSLAAPRPLWSVLGSERGTLLPSLDDALGRYLGQCEVDWAAGRSLPADGLRADRIPSEADLFFDEDTGREAGVVPMSPTPQVPSMG
jgi:hypothetical protein